MKLKDILLPQEKKFFPFFEKASHNLHEISQLLHNAVKEVDMDKRRNLILEISHLEHIGDDIKHMIFNALIYFLPYIKIII